MSRFPALAAGVFLALLPLAPVAHADGGSVLAEQRSGSYRITLFGSPTPLRAGPADLSVLIQDAKTGEPVLSRPVSIQVQAAASAKPDAWLPPCCSMKSSNAPVAATHANAQNKLLYAANLLVPSAGSHEILVRIGDEAVPVLSTTAEIAAPLPPVSTFWPYLALTPLAICGFALHQNLRRRPPPL